MMYRYEFRSVDVQTPEAAHAQLITFVFGQNVVITIRHEHHSRRADVLGDADDGTSLLHLVLQETCAFFRHEIVADFLPAEVWGDTFRNGVRLAKCFPRQIGRLTIV